MDSLLIYLYIYSLWNSVRSTSRSFHERFRDDLVFDPSVSHLVFAFSGKETQDFFSRQNLAETREDYIAIEVHREFLFETQPDIGRLEPFIAWA